MKKIVSLILSMAVAFSLSAPALAADNVFTDVNENDWYYSAVMRANELGLLKGMPDGTYSPDGQMTREQFITVAVRAIDKDAEAQGYSGDYWSYGYYRVAVKYGLIQSGQFNKDKADREKPMNRAEMAYVIKNALEIRGESLENDEVVPLSNIPDIGESGNYSNAVQFCYSMGVLVGVDTQGNYNPQGVLKRNAGATVAVRLVDASARKTPNFDAKPQQQQQQTTGVQTWKEGETHQPAKAGDVVIKADGTKVVLKEEYGILGYRQHVDYVTGTTINGVTLSSPDGHLAWYSGDKTTFSKCEETGEVFTRQEWGIIRRATKPQGYKGDYDGEIMNDYWKWNAQYNDWVWLGGGM